MKQIKIFTSIDGDRVEKEVNAWLTEMGDCNIMDIKFQTDMAAVKSTSHIRRMSIMIIYIKD